MLKRILFGLVVSLVVMASSSYAANADDVVNQTVQSFMEENDVPGAAVIVYVDGQPKSYYFGYADTDSKKPVTEKTIFEVGSISKVITSLLLAEELDFARVRLDQPINKYLKGLPDNLSDVSILSLATHTSGLPFEAPDNVKTASDWKAYAENLELAFDPKAAYQYSNVGIGLLGQVLERVERNNINNVFRKKIMAKLGMQPIGLTVPKNMRQYVAKGYDADGSPAKPVTNDVFAAAYGVKLSAGDMKKFLGAAIGLPNTPDSIFYPMRMTQTPYVSMGSYRQGLGWQIHKLSFGKVRWLMNGNDNLGLNSVAVSKIYSEPTFDGDALIDKTGATKGFKAYVGVIPNRKTGVAIMVNRKVPNDSVKIVARKILFKLNGLA